MGNLCNGLNLHDQALKIQQTPQNKTPTNNFINHNVQSLEDFNPQTSPKQKKQKIDFNQKIKIKNHPQVNYSNYKKIFEQRYQSAKRSYQQHYIDQANQYAQQFENLVQVLKQKNLIYTQTEQQKKLIQTIRREHRDVIFFQKEIERGAWDLKTDKNGIKISCRRQSDGTVGCRIQALSDVPFQILISIMIQVQFYKDYTPFLEVSRQEKQVSRNCRIGYTLNSIPLFTKRQSFFQGIGYSRLNHPSKEIFLYTRSIHDRKDIQDILNFPVYINSQYIQLDYKYFVVRYRPIKKNIGLIDIGMNIDVKMSFIPTWLMQKVAKDFGQNFFKNIVRISKNFKGSKWEKNVQKNPHLFLYFQKEVNSFLSKNSLI